MTTYYYLFEIFDFRRSLNSQLSNSELPHLLLNLLADCLYIIIIYYYDLCKYRYPLLNIYNNLNIFNYKK